MSTFLRLRNFAYITEAEIVFGDLTVFIGHQAGGKSLVAQLWKLCLDSRAIQFWLRTYGYVWKNWEDFLWVYFGKGHEQIWRNAEVEVGGNLVTPNDILSAHKRGVPKEQVFYIPAQRALSLAYGYGWPLPFKGFEDGTPFVLRQFSEETRRFLEEAFPESDAIVFPKEQWLPESLRKRFAESVYPGVVLRVDTTRRKQLVLEVVEGTHTRLPVYSWTVGQREFTPMLLALYRLLPTEPQKKWNGRWVVIEEPEMGLHPQAVGGIISSLPHLLCQGYRVILTTHSHTAIKLVQLMQSLKSMLGAVTRRKTEIRVYRFQRKGDGVAVAEASLPSDWDDMHILGAL